MRTVEWKLFNFQRPFKRNWHRQMTADVVVLLLVIASLSALYLLRTIHRREDAPTRHDERSNFANTRLVWPEELSDGDRIVEQLSYVPKGYRYDKTPIKQILIHTDAAYTGKLPNLGQAELVGCPVSQCWLTTDKSLGSVANAVLFVQNYTRPEFQRPSEQVWIMHHTDNPCSTSQSQMDNDAFNWTANYRRDSDIPRPYAYFMKYSLPLTKNSFQTYHKKDKLVAWFVTDCRPDSGHAAYTDELSKYIPIDVYGDCESDRNRCFEMLRNEYKFYLSFESAFCTDYITERFFVDALKNEVVPVVMGPSRRDYELVAPENSFIHVDDFGSPAELADHLKRLSTDTVAYRAYFDWYKTGTIVTDTRFYCRLCAMLHDQEHAPKYYANITHWWSGPGVCRR